MPKSFCAPPICMRHQFNIGAAALRYTIDGHPPGAAINTLPDFADYDKQWQAMRAGLLKPIDLNCDDDCRCVRFGVAPTLPNQPVPIVLGEWKTVDDKPVRWEVTGVTVDIWVGNCVPEGIQVKVGDGPYRPSNSYPHGFGADKPASPGSGHKSGGKKKKKRGMKRRAGAKASRRRR